MTSTRNKIREMQDMQEKAEQAKADLEATSPQVLDQIALGLLEQLSQEPLSVETKQAFSEHINQLISYVGALRNLMVYMMENTNG